MKFGAGREKRKSGGRKRGKRQVLMNKTPSSEKPETLLLRSWTLFQKHVFPDFREKKATSQKQKTASKFFLTDRFRDFFCSSDPNFRQSADCRKLGSLDCMVVVMSKLFMW